MDDGLFAFRRKQYMIGSREKNMYRPRPFLLLTRAVLLMTFVAGKESVRLAAQSALDFSCSTFPKDLSEAALIVRFGAANVKSAPIVGFDDGPQDGTIVFGDQPDAKVEIFWNDPSLKRSPSSILVRGEKSRWRTSNGLTLGIDLRNVEQINRQPFRLAGPATEGHGIVISWAGGRLESLSNVTCSIKVNLQPRFDGNEDPNAMRQLSSGRNYSSGHPAMQKLNPSINAILIQYP